MGHRLTAAGQFGRGLCEHYEAVNKSMADGNASVGVTVYRVWIHTEVDKEAKGSYGEVNVCLHGALGSVWLEQLQACQPSAGRLFPTSKVASSASERCEIYVSAEEVGTLYRVTVAYAHGASDSNCRPWRLSQVVVRHGSDGMVSTFPCTQPVLKGPKALVELVPQLTWHEDLYGNCAEAPPPVPETGQWHWPAAPPAAITMGDDAQQRTEHDALQLAIYRAVCEEEILPLMDAALNDLTMQRTPGTFLHRCVQAASGRAPASAATAKQSAGTLPPPKPSAAPTTPAASVPTTASAAGATAAAAAGAAAGATAAPSGGSCSNGGSSTEREVQMAREHIRRLEREKSELEATSRSSLELIVRQSSMSQSSGANGTRACVLL